MLTLSTTIINFKTVACFEEIIPLLSYSLFSLVANPQPSAVIQ